MVRDVAYEGLSFRRRRDLHSRAAAAIEEESLGHPDDAADQLAMHYSLGGNHERTWHYALIAADRAMRSYANVEAATQYESALKSVERLPSVSDMARAEVWTDLGDAKERAGLFAEALASYQRAFRLVSDDKLASAEVLLKRAWVRERAAQLPMALGETTKARRLVETIDSHEAARLVARAIAFSASVRLRQERPKDALKRAVEAADRAKNADEMTALARAFSVMAWAHLRLGNPGALELSRQALELYEDLNDLVGQTHMNNNLGMLAYFDGRWGDALTYYEESRAGSELLGNVVDVGFVEANIGELLVNQRRFDEAEVRLLHSSRVLRASGELLMANFADQQLGRVLTERGRFEEAMTLLLRAREEAIDNDLTVLVFESALHMADCLIRSGEPDEAVVLLNRASLEAGDEASMYLPKVLWLRGAALVAVGQVNAALNEVDQGLSLARERNSDYEIAQLLLVRSKIVEPGEPELVDQYRSEAAEIFSRLDVRSGLVAVQGASG
jgi:tetratricopeptide (TPR) repeat protein